MLHTLMALVGKKLLAREPEETNEESVHASAFSTLKREVQNLRHEYEEMVGNYRAVLDKLPNGLMMERASAASVNDLHDRVVTLENKARPDMTWVKDDLEHLSERVAQCEKSVEALSELVNHLAASDCCHTNAKPASTESSAARNIRKKL